MAGACSAANADTMGSGASEAGTGVMMGAAGSAAANAEACGASRAEEGRSGVNALARAKAAPIGRLWPPAAHKRWRWQGRHRARASIVCVRLALFVPWLTCCTNRCGVVDDTTVLLRVVPCTCVCACVCTIGNTALYMVCGAMW